MALLECCGFKYEENSNIGRAVIFCMAAHGAMGQMRKNTNKPYHVHCMEVAEMVREYGGDENSIIAALLHDVIEDTSIDSEMIEQLFGLDVMQLVVGLTDISRPEDGNRAIRKRIDLLHLAGQSVRCRTVKLADLISNASTIADLDPGFAPIYLNEMKLILPHLSHRDCEINQLLYKRACGTLRWAEDVLKQLDGD